MPLIEKTKFQTQSTIRYACAKYEPKTFIHLNEIIANKIHGGNQRNQFDDDNNSEHSSQSPCSDDDDNENENGNDEDEDEDDGDDDSNDESRDDLQLELQPNDRSERPAVNNPKCRNKRNSTVLQ